MKNDYKGQTQKIVLGDEWYDILIKAIQTHYLQDIKEVKIEQIVKQLSQ